MRSLAFRDDGDGFWTVGWTLVEPYTSPMPFEIANLPAGTYRVCFTSQDFEFVPVFADECVGGSPSPETGTEIEVVAGEVTPGADVEVGQASRIRGRVTGIDAPVSVELLTASGELIYKRLTLADGTYGFSGLPERLLQDRLQPRPRRDPPRGALLPQQARAHRRRWRDAGRARRQRRRKRDLDRDSSPAARSPVASSTPPASAYPVARCALTRRMARS